MCPASMSPCPCPTVHRQPGRDAAQQPGGDRGRDEEDPGEWTSREIPLRKLRIFLLRASRLKSVCDMIQQEVFYD